MRTRRSFLRTGAVATAGAAAAAYVRFPADAAQFTYKFSVDRPASDAFTQQIAAAGARVLSETNGQLEIRVFPNNALGGSTKVLAAVREGAIEFVAMPDVIASDIVPNAAIDAIAFAFPDYKSAWAAMDGPLGSYVRDQIQTQMGVATFQTVWDAGFKAISNSARSLNVPDDIKGLKIRATPGPITVSLYKTLGASPVAMDLNEIYSAMQTKLVDGADVTAALVLSSKLYEVQKYLTVTNHAMNVNHILISSTAWQALPKTAQAIVEKNFDTGARAMRATAAKDADSTLDALRKAGVIVNKPDTSKFRAVLRTGGYYAYWKDKFGPVAWSALERAAGKLS